MSDFEFFIKKVTRGFGGIGKNTLSLHPLSERGQRSEGDKKQGPGIEKRFYRARVSNRDGETIRAMKLKVRPAGHHRKKLKKVLGKSG